MSDDEIERIREQKRQELVESRQQPTEPVHVESEQQLDDILETHDTVLVDFHAVWCGPCQMMEPAIEQLAADGDAVVAKVDVDQQQQIARSWGVQSMPTLVVAKDGEPVDRAVGAQSYAGLKDLVA